MLENPFKVNEMLPDMTSDHDMEWLAAQLMPRVKGVLGPKADNAPLRAITWSTYRIDGDDNVIITGDRWEAFAGVCVYAVYQSGSPDLQSNTWEHTLKVCETEDVAERLAAALRTLVYGRERLAGRMRSRDGD